MTKVAVIYYSSQGNVHKLAVAAAAAAEKAGAEVRLRRTAELSTETVVPGNDAWNKAWAEHLEAVQDIPEAAVEDLEWADAVLWGTPGRYGLPAASLKHFIDQTLPLHMRRGLVNKVMSSFTSTATLHGGQESTLLALNNAFYHWGAIIVPPGVADAIQLAPTNGNPYGVSSVSRNEAGNVDDDNLAAIEYQARRTVEITEALQRGLRTA
ncbi:MULTISPECIES: NAD(P)H-dependent oxidoreductase [Streptomyces]|uniref:NAD(P)H dehydrogenase n=1 Tax=Streptomyces rhizosphaericola TaxID=2564098 RepID=A0ABY2PGY0_9ACTN|nr:MULTISPECIES: NAD(P)H-dependent oxidoreductase [Streptomyces]ARI54811.1 NAD(P)H dehydrogenase [Streptomyces sp. S8]MYT94079.1 NAD(P)H dehydrogenase [Streptomyces sp. SID8359]MYU00647.1 NAD(P)H dehydrogenase [Streptomyces sp. SID8350]TGZ10173.1 NAD(P)H dehydrogenase [Streptomyces rhizosphaericola]SCK09195.1 NAD(P)H dehydrogenase (quinone) [Streptomyces sp. AmelKG-D3]